jgi:hypothetical protein
MAADPTWHFEALDQWMLRDAHGNLLRHVVKLGPYIGDPGVKYRVTGAGHDATDHPTLDEAKLAAEASLRAP